jgi:hypothetical protein
MNRSQCMRTVSYHPQMPQEPATPPVWTFAPYVGMSLFNPENYCKRVLDAIKKAASNAPESRELALKLTGNIAWRFDETCYSADVWSSRDNYDRTHFSARLAADYLLNRWTSIFAHLIWDNQTTDTNKYYEYDRIRGVLGVRFHY